jgi:hypothetical protein
MKLNTSDSTEKKESDPSLTNECGNKFKIYGQITFNQYSFCDNEEEDSNKNNSDNDDSEFECTKSNNNRRIKSKTNKKSSASERNFFKDRNLIKKVKTNCINIYEKLIKSCLTQPKSFSLYNIQNKLKREELRLFKSDISKVRNKSLLSVPMKVLINLFSDYDLDSMPVIKNKNNKFNYLMNITFYDLILHIKKQSTGLFKSNLNSLNKKGKIMPKDIKVYLEYINDTNYAYGVRSNVDNKYISNYNLIEGYKLNANEGEHIHQMVENFLGNFECFNM